jgi:predicted amidohydrolase YtcJ
LLVEPAETPYMTTRTTAIVLLFWILLAAQATAGRTDEAAREQAAVVAADVVFKGGTLIDGSGAAARRADLAVRGDRIVAVGSFAIDPKARIVDVSSLVVAPGFIDLHTHSDDGITESRTRLNLNYLTQGVTTVVTGNCGSGPVDVASYLASVDAHGAGTNVIHLIPQGSLRSAVMGVADRPPSQAELDRMKNLVARGMAAGAWGMASGLIYVPSRYASMSELIELAKVVAGSGGFYASHIRDEEGGLLEAIDEAIAIGKSAGLPVHISHLKANGQANWGKAVLALERIKTARQSGQVVTADQYPYIASSTRLGAMVVPHWAVQVSGDEFARMAASPDRGPLLRAEIQRELDRRGGGGAIRIARFAPQPSRVGLDLVTIARQEGGTPLDIVLDIQRKGGAQAINFGMSESNVRTIMSHSFVATASDGATHLPGGGDRPHPRAYGTFPRKIRYALDEHVLSLEQAVRSCTGLPAEILGLAERGVIRPGAFADLVVFDPKSFRDAATFDEPTRFASGVSHLYVNGVALIAGGKPLFKPGTRANLPGRALRPRDEGPAGLIVSVGRIWTGDRAQPWAESVACRGGALLAVGNRQDVMRYKGPRTTIIERTSAFAMPGLFDAHGHIESLGASLEQVDLRGVSSLDEVARRVKARVDSLPSGAWLSGANWDQSLWTGGVFPTAAVLDTVAPSRPVWMTRVDGHAGWANTEAMRRAGINKETKAPSDGQIVRDKDGLPTGVFIDGAMSLVSKVVPRPSRGDIKRRILAAQTKILAQGLTGVHDAGISQTEAEVYRELDRSGELMLRVYGMASPPGGREVEFVSRPPAMPTTGARFELRAIKLFIDGAMGSRGALLFEPYHDDPENKGLLLIEPKVLEATTVAALKSGWQVATHAIGDRGNALVLDAYAAALKAVPQARDPRLRIEHAQVVRKQDVARFAELKIIASMQPSHASDDMRWADARLGPARVQGAYAWRWFVDAKTRLAFGSDFPVEIVNPFWGIYAAITRQDATGRPPGGWHSEHLLSLEDTLRGFTAGSAYAAFAEDRLGMLKAGMQADLTVVDTDLFNATPALILKDRTLMTIIAGRVAFERD